jgi:hypothetical protein
MINEIIRRPPNAVVLGLQAPMLFHIFLDKSRWQKWSVVFKPTTRHVLLKMGEAMIECYKSSSSSSAAASFLLPNKCNGGSTDRVPQIIIISSLPLSGRKLQPQLSMLIQSKTHLQ